MTADVAELVTELRALTARVRLCEDALRDALARLDAAERDASRARAVAQEVVRTGGEITPEMVAAGERVLA